DISTLVQEVAEANRPLAARKEQTITVSALPNQVVSCDADRIREAIDNLVSNAVKYSPIGGAVDLFVGPEAGGILVQGRARGAGLPRRDIPGLSGVSSGLPPSRPAGRPRPGSVFQSSSVSSICTVGASRSKAQDRERARPSSWHCRVT